MKRHNSRARLLATASVLALAMALLPATAAAQHVQRTPTPEADPIGSGWWKLNQEKSSYGAGSSALARALAETRHYYLRDDGFWVMAIYTELWDGRRAFSQTVFKLDGEPRPSTYTDESLAVLQATGAATTATSSQAAIDPHTVHIRIFAADGKLVTTNTRVLAPDGRSFTLKTETTDDRGRPVSTTRVFERFAQ